MGRKGIEVVVSELEREQLLSMSRSRSLPHSLVRRAKIVLMAAAGHTNQEIAMQCEVTSPAITHWKKRFVAHGLAGPALRQLHDEEYVCHIGYLDLPRIAKGTLATFEFVRTPMVFCMQGSTQPDDFCVERHVNLNIGWQDPKAPESELSSQLASSVITDRVFRCDTASDVKRR
ncbi:helix-turn-helix domain-containing protein [Ralstonia solanacearum]|uniref:helix-turn-helix domain-containing protein n=1 Tax=Ralstonia solanacearum TaxID=305 RepID=UPI002F9519D0